MLLNTDEKRFGGQERIKNDNNYEYVFEHGSFKIYLPSRCAIILVRK